MYQTEPGAAGTEQASGGASGGADTKSGSSKSDDQGPIIDAEVVDEKKMA